MAKYAQTAETHADSAVVAWLQDKELRKQSQHTIRNSTRAIDSWRAFLATTPISDGRSTRRSGLWDADPSYVRAWQASMRNRNLRPTTINHALACVSAFYEFALARQCAPCHLLVNPFRLNVKRETVDAYDGIRTLTLEEYRRFVAYLENRNTTVTGARAHALLRTFLHTGWRAGELLPMRWGQIQSLRTAPNVHRYVWPARSGSLTSDVLPADCRQAILHYLQLANRPLESMEPPDFIWTPIREPHMAGLGASVDLARPICVKTALRVLRTHLHAAGIAQADQFRLLDLRHTHAFLLVQSGATAAEINARLHHAQRSTTEKYLRRTFASEPTDKHSRGFAALRGE